MPSLSGLDRKAMEEDRLNRLALKRKTTHEVETHRATKVQRVESTISTRATKPATAAASNDNGAIQYPHGVFKKTWVFGQARKNDIKIEEVLQKHDLKVAVLSAFKWDMEWVFSKLDVSKTKLVLVMEAKDEATKAQYRDESIHWSKGLRLCFPPMPGQVRCMHSKLMLLFHPNYMRIAIPTANLLNFDWGETGIMENSVFIIDLPRLTGMSSQRPELTPFAKDLLYFLEAMGIDQDVKDGVVSFNFAETKNLAFVHTIGGSHTGDSLKKTGYPQLGRGVKQLGLQSGLKDPLQATFATSSVGSLNEAQLEALHTSLKGKDPVLPSGVSKGKASASLNVQPMYLPSNMRSLKDRFHIVFPSHKTVQESKGGTQNGGTICMSSKYWDNPNFPKASMREYISARPGILSHNKIILARTPDKAFYYVGSANISQSAWGQMVWDRTAKAPKLNARNWECGVLVPVTRSIETKPEIAAAVKVTSHASEVINLDSSTESEGEPVVSKKPKQATLKGKEKDVSPPPLKRSTQDAQSSAQVLPMSVFAGSIDVPFELPARSYIPGQRPWFFMGDEGGRSTED